MSCCGGGSVRDCDIQIHPGAVSSSPSPSPLDSGDEITIIRSAEHQPYDLLHKIVLIGDSNVGKSSIISRFVDGDFGYEHISTIGIAFHICYATVRDCTVKLQIWDTSGQERFRSINNSYYRGAGSVIVVYDVTNKTSLDHCRQWIYEIHENGVEYENIILVGNKADTEDMAMAVTIQEAKDLAEEYGIPYFRVSALHNIRIDDIFKPCIEHAYYCHTRVMVKTLPTISLEKHAAK